METVVGASKSCNFSPIYFHVETQRFGNIWFLLPGKLTISASIPTPLDVLQSLMLPTRNAVLQDKNFLAVNEFSNELSFQNSEEMPSDMLGSAKQEGNGSSVPTVINRMWFVYSPHLLPPVPCQGCARMSLPAMAWRNPRFLSQYQILCQRRKWLQAKEQTKLSIVSWILVCFSGAFIILPVQLPCSWLQSRGNLIKWEGKWWVTNFKRRCVEKPLWWDSFGMVTRVCEEVHYKKTVLKVVKRIKWSSSVGRDLRQSSSSTSKKTTSGSFPYQPQKST